MDTLFLDPTNWDLTVDASRNIAVATNPYALAQDAASAIKVFLGEVYYDTTQGIPYWEEILGQLPSLEIMKGQLIEVALTVPEIVAAQVFILDFKNRVLSGQVQVTDKNGVITAANF